jgi:hypothetical protein
MEIIDFILLILDVISTVWDLGSYFESRENRKERKEAKDLGREPPEKNRGTRAFYILTPVVVILTTYLIWRIWRRLLR